MGKCTIDIQDLMKWLGLIQHKLDKKIVINLVIYDENDKKIQKEVFKRKNGLRDLLTEIETSETTKIVDGGKDMQFKERIKRRVFLWHQYPDRYADASHYIQWKNERKGC